LAAVGTTRSGAKTAEAARLPRTPVQGRGRAAIAPRARVLGGAALLVHRRTDARRTVRRVIRRIDPFPRGRPAVSPRHAPGGPASRLPDASGGADRPDFRRGWRRLAAAAAGVAGALRGVR